MAHEEPVHPVSISGAVDARDLMLVLRARRVRRDLKLLGAAMKVVVVAGVLGTCGVLSAGNFTRFGCRSKQSEAKGNLKALYVAQERYRADHDAYSDDPDAIDFQPKGQTLRYRYAITDVGGEGASPTFRAWAIAVDPHIEGDVWSISEKNDVTHLQDGCDR